MDGGDELEVLEVLNVLDVLEGVNSGPLEHLEHIEHLQHLELSPPQSRGFRMHRRSFLVALGLAACAPRVAVTSSRRLKRVGIQLYSLRDDARRNLERTLADIAAVGYKDVELLGSMDNFGMPAAQLRRVLDQHGLRAPSTHVGGNALNDLDRQLDDAKALGHQYLTVASLPITGPRTVEEYRRWADRLNDAGRRARQRDVWIAFHNHANDFTPDNGAIPYDALIERTDPDVVRMQLDTGNLAMAGLDPHEYMRRYGSRYWSFHIKDVPQLGATQDVELGKGAIDFRRLLASIDRIDEKHLFVEQETYPGAPLDSMRRDFEFISQLEF